MTRTRCLMALYKDEKLDEEIEIVVNGQPKLWTFNLQLRLLLNKIIGWQSWELTRIVLRNVVCDGQCLGVRLSADIVRRSTKTPRPLHSSAFMECCQLLLSLPSICAALHLRPLISSLVGYNISMTPTDRGASDDQIGLLPCRRYKQVDSTSETPNFRPIKDNPVQVGNNEDSRPCRNGHVDCGHLLGFKYASFGGGGEGGGPPPRPTRTGR
ncbi:hypothetical protein Nepgr_013791 [Nepenthes gracilis]|uniref:Uncharacterized protein n=1 Tax=Nepenthes gracilis TaxID=150966 RepID=A0AAD3SJH0_NEPGR|nr:hypothetical protein Nepgr_013791 [Nepenthes gracilis]